MEQTLTGAFHCRRFLLQFSHGIKAGYRRRPQNGSRTMAEETVTETQAEQPNQGDATEPSANGGTPATFTQADIQRIIDQTVAKERAKAEKLAEKAKQDAEAKALADQGNYKTLYEKAQKEAADALERATKLERAALQAQVATKTGLPAALASRLMGDTEADMEADARSMLAALPKPAAPNINSAPGNGGAPLPGQLNDQEKAELSAIYGVRIK
jgi:hypothetical protein